LKGIRSWEGIKYRKSSVSARTRISYSNYNIYVFLSRKSSEDTEHGKGKGPGEQVEGEISGEFGCYVGLDGEVGEMMRGEVVHKRSNSGALRAHNPRS